MRIRTILAPLFGLAVTLLVGCPSDDDDVSDDDATGDDDDVATGDDDTTSDDDDDDTTASPFFSANEAPFGKTLAEWAEDWNVWLWSIPSDDNPLYGGDCDQEQNDPNMFFLGTSTVINTPFRTCTVPAGKAIFLTSAMYNCYPCPALGGIDECEFATEDGLSGCLSGFPWDYTYEISVVLDGVQLDNPLDYLATSAAYEVPILGEGESLLGPCSGPWETGNMCDVEPGPFLAIVAGYWVMIRPPDPGEHTLEMSGSVAGEFAYDLSYTLMVE